jgi:hypothetical protein
MCAIKESLRKAILGLIVVSGGIVGLSPSASGQGVDQEPNNTCVEAQFAGDVPLPFAVNGSLETPPDIPDVDFLRFSGSPETMVRVDLEGQSTGQGTLPDSLLGLFDSNCNLIAANDDSGGTLNSRLSFLVPADGIFVVAATAYPDFGFTGAGGSSGTYRMTIAATVVIGSISGRIVDAVTEEPVPGDVAPFAAAQLLRCEETGCVSVNSTQADSEARFWFNTDSAGQPLEVGTYQVVAFAQEYQQGQTEPFQVEEGEDRDVGDVPLRPFPIQLLEIRPCENLPPQGGICSSRVRIANRTGSRLQGAAWSIVTAWGIGSLIDFTTFQTASPKKVTLSSRQSKVIRFDFEVPATVRDGAYMCADVYFGDSRLEPSFNTIWSTPLFCIQKGAGGLAIVADEQAQKLRQNFDVRPLIRARK